MKSFRGQVVVITGAGGGIGRAIAEELLTDGAAVIGWDLNEEALQALTREAKKYSWDLSTDIVDVTKPETVRAARDRAIAARGRIDVWINNAGIAFVKSFTDTTEVEFDRVLAVNLHGAVGGTRMALEHMENRGAGVIVNVASVAGFIAGPYLSSYCAAKHGLVGFTNSLQEELRLRSSPVKAVLVAPGFVDTALIARGEAHGFPEWISWILATPGDVGREIVEGLRRGRTRIFPTWNGRLMMRAFRLFPGATVRSSRLLLVRSFKDFLRNRYTVE